MKHLTLGDRLCFVNSVDTEDHYVILKLVEKFVTLVTKPDEDYGVLGQNITKDLPGWCKLLKHKCIFRYQNSVLKCMQN